MLTLSSMARNLGFSALLAFILVNAIVDGVSRQTIICYSVSSFCRFLGLILSHSYLPIDGTGDWFYQFIEISSTLLCLALVWKLKKEQFLPVQSENEPLNVGYLLAGTLVVSLLFKSSTSGKYLADLTWSYSMYLESIAMLPQMLYFYKKKRSVKSGIGNFVVAQAISLLFSFVFWISCYDELHSWTGVIILGSQAIELVIYWFFLYPYFEK